LRTTCDQFLLVANGKATPFDGDLDDYAAWIAEQRSKETVVAINATASTNKKNTYAQNKSERQARIAERRPLIKESETLEKDIAAWQLEKSACDARLNDTTLYENTDKTELQALLKQQSALTSHIAQAEERWLNVQEQLEMLAEV
jgi:ATP-binding cassette subfamily F protein 3